MSDEEQIAELREEMRRAGHLAGETRRKMLWLGFAAFFVAAVCLFQTVSNPPRSQLGLPLVMAGLVVAAGPAAAMALWVSEVYYLIRRAQLGRELGRLPRASRADVLLPLRRDERGDTRQMADSLLRRFGLPSEVAPAAASDARGDEASPAESVP